jgi:hypothetical protein
MQGTNALPVLTILLAVGSNTSIVVCVSTTLLLLLLLFVATVWQLQQQLHSQTRNNERLIETTNLKDTCTACMCTGLDCYCIAVSIAAISDSTSLQGCAVFLH